MKSMIDLESDLGSDFGLIILTISAPSWSPSPANLAITGAILPPETRELGSHEHFRHFFRKWPPRRPKTDFWSILDPS